MKKHLLGLLLLVATHFSAVSQIIEPVTWQTSVEKISEKEYNLVATAKIPTTFHLYSQNVPENGPIPTSFTYEQTGSTFELVGKTTEGKGHTVEDSVFEMTITFFENKAVFKQHIKTLGDTNTVKALVEYMICNDTRCSPPIEEDLVFDLTKAKPAKGMTTTTGQQFDKNTTEGNTRSLWSIFIIAFLSGFVALLTPCVFPMIPMTVSFFIKQSKNRSQGIKNAIAYGLFIILIYVLLGTVVTAVFGADALNALATNVWFNLIFFLLLVIFAASFLGAFEIMLPNSWANKVDAKAGASGFAGVFFMALALAIVSFSCTGPIVGTLLVEAASTGSIAPIVGMLGFSLAIALPFALFAAFPSWLQNLPKSGSWLNTVKVVLGFIELALAFKFLSQADLVLQLHLLERELFIAIWIAIFGTLTIYLFGKLQLPHDSPVAHISVGRLGLGLLTLTFTLYMIPGLWGAPLNLISAFPPPQHYSESPYGVGYTKTPPALSTNPSQSSRSHKLPQGAHLMPPYDILTFNDYDKGVAYAKKMNKPILLDFTGHACVNCRKMEQNVWPKEKVLNILKNDLVLISLYVDDKRPLAPEEIVASKLRPGKKLKYIGQKWSELQTLKYKANSQPFYVLIAPDERTLVAPVAYTPNVDTYYTWLKSGIEAYQKH